MIVGDFNVAPLECDVWSHKALLKVVSHTPVEVEALTRLQQAHDWIDIGRRFVPAPERCFTWWSYRSPDWTRNDRGRRLDHMWASPELAGHSPRTSARAVPGMGAAFGPRAVDLRARDLSDRPDPPGDRRASCRTAGEDRRRAPIAVMAVETATRELLELLDPDGKAPLLISGERAAALVAGQYARSRRPGTAGAGRARTVARCRDARSRLPIPGATSTAGRSGRCSRSDRLRRGRQRGTGPGANGRAAAGPVAARADRPRSLSVAESPRANAAPRSSMVARAKLPLEDLPDTQIVAFRASDDGAGACRAGDRRVRRRAASGPAAQRMPDRRRVRLVEMRLRAAAQGSAEADRRRLEAGSCSTCARKAGGSALPTSFAPMRSRTAGSTRLRPTAGSGLPTTSATMPMPPRSCARSESTEVRLLTNNPAKVAGLEAAGIAVVERVPHHMPANPHNADYLATKRKKSGHLP